jgi:hypothetical protein
MNDSSDNKINCTCPKKKCVNYKKCALCRAKHELKGGKPHCERESLFKKMFSKLKS